MELSGNQRIKADQGDEAISARGEGRVRIRRDLDIGSTTGHLASRSAVSTQREPGSESRYSSCLDFSVRDGCAWRQYRLMHDFSLSQEENRLDGRLDSDSQTHCPELNRINPRETRSYSSQVSGSSTGAGSPSQRQVSLSNNESSPSPTSPVYQKQRGTHQHKSISRSIADRKKQIEVEDKPTLVNQRMKGLNDMVARMSGLLSDSEDLMAQHGRLTAQR